MVGEVVAVLDVVVVVGNIGGDEPEPYHAAEAEVAKLVVAAESEVAVASAHHTLPIHLQTQ